MFQHKLRRKNIFMAALVALPLALAGCSGGSSGGSSGAVQQSYDFSAQFSDAVNIALPTNIRITKGQGFSNNQNGYNYLGFQFTENNESPSFLFSVGKLGTIQIGDSFTLQASGQTPADSSLTYRSGNNSDSYISQSGTLRVTGLTNHPAQGTRPATTTIRFTISDVVLRGHTNPSKGVKVTGSGEVTIPFEGTCGIGGSLD